jgi:hypothetical protein
MRIADYVTARLTSGSLVLVLLVSMSAVALPAAQETDTVQGREGAHPAAQSTGPISAQPNGEQLPDSPGAQQLKTIDKDKAAGWSEAPESSPEPRPRGKRKPVGTAAAEISDTTGFAAARPAGAAMAPAKQRRMRTILISVGAVAGAAVALGTVMALSKATPSKPPGSQ